MKKTPLVHKHRPLSHEPKRYTLEGKARYCSPSCGRHCTLAEHRKAQVEAEKIRKALGPDHWTAVVWENLGWHAKVQLRDVPNVEVQKRGVRTYLADAIIPDERQAYGYGKTPRLALLNVEARLKLRMLDIDRIFMKISRALRT